MVELTDVESTNHAELASGAVLIGAVRGGHSRYRFPPLANTDTFGTFAANGESAQDAALGAITALRSGAAFWKR